MRKAMENQSLSSTEEIGNWIKLSKVWIFFIVPEISLFAFKYRPGENPLYEADHVVVFGLLGLSLIVYITTLVALSLMKTPKPPTSRRLPLSILVHVCWSCGALACGILSSLLFLYGWVMFCFYALFLWAAPCEPVANLSRRLLRRWPNSNTDSIDLTLVVVELPVPQPAAISTLDIHQDYSNSTSSKEDLENPQIWKYI